MRNYLNFDSFMTLTTKNFDVNDQKIKITTEKTKILTLKTKIMTKKIALFIN